MDHYEERMEPRKVLVKTTCDLCGAEAPNGIWPTPPWHTDETEIMVKVKRREGEVYPEFGCGTEINVDLCPRCFVEKLVPWLRSEGVQIEEQEWDW